MSTPEPQGRRPVLTRQVIYLVLVAATAVPLLMRWRMDVKPREKVQGIYDKIESLEPGSPVLLSLDFDPASLAELKPMSVAVLRHCFQRELRPIVMTHWVAGLGLVRSIVEDAAATAAKENGSPVVSGEHYAFLGYKPGGGNLILNMGESLRDAYGKDYYGQSTEGMPVLEGVDSLRKIPLVVDFAAGVSVEMWIAYGRDRFHFDLGAGCTGVMAPDLYPFLDSGQLIGLIGGLRGAAEYEVLVEKAGDGITGMVAQSVAHVLIILLIVTGNVLFVFRRPKPEARG